MTKKISSITTISPLILLIITLLVVIIGCNNSIIQIVPVSSPTPANVADKGQEITLSLNSLASETHIPDRIAAQIIGLDAPVAAMGWQMIEQGDDWVSQWNMPELEAAWHQNSAGPGEGSNIVISGHNESTGGQVFAEVEELQVGDEITLWRDDGEAYIYQVIEKNIIRTFAASNEAQNYLLSVTQPTAQEQLTLITCWPRWTNTHRLVVIAQPKPTLSPP